MPAGFEGANHRAMKALPRLGCPLFFGLFLLLPLGSTVWASAPGETEPLIEFAEDSRKPILVISPRLMELGEVSGDPSRIFLDLLIGQETALRLGLDVLSLGDRTSLVFEGLFGGALGIAGITPVAGGGVRIQIEVARTASFRNALLVSPALDLLVAWDSSPEDGGMIDLGPDSNVVLLSTNVEVAWLHRVSRQFGIVLGLHAGAQVSLGGLSNIGEQTRGRVGPELSVFFGIRF